jgi:ribosomal protein L32E
MLNRKGCARKQPWPNLNYRNPSLIQINGLREFIRINEEKHSPKRKKKNKYKNLVTGSADENARRPEIRDSIPRRHVRTRPASYLKGTVVSSGRKAAGA